MNRFKNQILFGLATVTICANAVALTAIAQKPKPVDKEFRLRQNSDGTPDFECHQMEIGSIMSRTEIRDFLNDSAQEAYDYGCVILVIKQEG